MIKLNPTIKHLIIFVAATLFVIFVQRIITFKDTAVLPRVITYEEIKRADQEDPKLIEYLVRQVLRTPSNQYQLNKPEIRDTSEFKQGVFLEKYFKGKKFGTFIEAGAFDGEKLSNTLLLERFYDWTGLLIEPNPVNYQMLSNKGRRSYIAKCGLSASKVHGKFPISINSVWSHLNLSSNEKTRPIEAIKDESFVEVDCFPLYSLMVAANLTTLDLLVLDLEGLELKVLQTLPLDKINVANILIEVINIPEGKRKVAEFMRSNNYELVQEIPPLDCFYTKKTK